MCSRTDENDCGGRTASAQGLPIHDTDREQKVISCTAAKTPIVCRNTLVPNSTIAPHYRHTHHHHAVSPPPHTPRKYGASLGEHSVLSDGVNKQLNSG